ncbi:hypothetical protein BDF20DRAFT_841239 [Mycotypha africana]|uniref:uncharacterized protein n=1 Tax=Mycotypha africana TaxID=64632 RepID=UPI0023018D51|nr:uncharacterized protein BDF20DRAFT_841239 [Mycotypha africana]KAI8990860.1 hypothetical protein BDF20DRAFT_841239 [Mycotypha africana]
MNHRSAPSLSSSISSNETSCTDSPSRTTSICSSLHNNKSNNHYLTATPYQSILDDSYPYTVIPIAKTTIGITMNAHQNYPNSGDENDSVIKSYSDLPRKKRWDDSQLEMELAEDDLIDQHQKRQKMVRRNPSSSSYSSSYSASSLSSSLRFTHKLRFPQALSIKQKFRHHYRSGHQHSTTTAVTSNVDTRIVSTATALISEPFRKIRQWLA